MVKANQEVDARGLRCPLPLLKAKQALNTMTVGESLQVLATDQGSVRDFRTYTDLSGHVLLSFTEQDGEYCYLIEKR